MRLIVPADQRAAAAASRFSRDGGGTKDERGSVDNNYPYLFLLHKHRRAEIVSLHRYNSLLHAAVLLRNTEDNQHQKASGG